MTRCNLDPSPTHSTRTQHGRFTGTLLAFWIAPGLLALGIIGCAKAPDAVAGTAVASSGRIGGGAQSGNDSDQQTTPQGSHVNANDEPELGQVHWLRDWDEAKARSKSDGRPLFVQFQEVPGCQTCRNFGGGPLSHPLMVEAIETLFVPVLVYNNKTEDDEIRASFSEPAWNNPVTRFLDAELNDIIERRDGVWETAALAERMMAALQQQKREVPKWFSLFVQNQRASRAEAVFAMHCYWEGEARLGGLPGVLETHSAWIGDKEVVRVAFDPDAIAYDSLLKKALEMECASTVFAADKQQWTVAHSGGELDVVMLDREAIREAKPSDQKYYLQNSPLRHLPMTPQQATHVNAVLYSEKDMSAALEWLSPRQREMQAGIETALAQGATFAGLPARFPGDNWRESHAAMRARLQKKSSVK